MIATLPPSKQPARRPPAPLSISFEFFPPKTEALEAQLWSAFERLSPFQPAFASVTYGAGGSTRDRTHRIVARMRRTSDVEPAAHLTCVDASRAAIQEVIESYLKVGVRHIVALRGDPQDGTTGYEPTPGGYAYAADLVAGLKVLAEAVERLAG